MGWVRDCHKRGGVLSDRDIIRDDQEMISMSAVSYVYSYNVKEAKRAKRKRVPETTLFFSPLFPYFWRLQGSSALVRFCRSTSPLSMVPPCMRLHFVRRELCTQNLDKKGDVSEHVVTSTQFSHNRSGFQQDGFNLLTSPVSALIHISETRRELHILIFWSSIWYLQVFPAKRYDSRSPNQHSTTSFGRKLQWRSCRRHMWLNTAFDQPWSQNYRLTVHNK